MRTFKVNQKDLNDFIERVVVDLVKYEASKSNISTYAKECNFGVNTYVAKNILKFIKKYIANNYSGTLIINNGNYRIIGVRLEQIDKGKLVSDYLQYLTDMINKNKNGDSLPVKTEPENKDKSKYTIGDTVVVLYDNVICDGTIIGMCYHDMTAKTIEYTIDIVGYSDKLTVIGTDDLYNSPKELCEALIRNYRLTRE